MNAPALPAQVRSWANARTAAGTLLAVLILAVVYIVLVAPWLRDNMGSAALLDEMRWNSPADLTSTLVAYGGDGRDFYRNLLLVDLFFPIVYSIPLALSVAFAAPRLSWPSRLAHIAPLLPIVGGIFDWGENILFLIQLNRFPDHPDSLSWLALVMTFLKFVALISSVIIIALGLWVYRRERRESSYRSNHQSR